MSRSLRPCFGLLALGLPSFLSATEEGGFPVIEHFPPYAYRGHSQVFQGTQDSRGIVYLTNFGAVLAYDGERWTRIPVPDTTFLYGLAVLPDDRLAVSGVGQIGLIEPDGRGGQVFRSLLPEVPEAYRDGVDEVWDLYATPEGVFFFGRRLMLRWHEGVMRAWRFETEKMIYGFWSGSAIYIQNLDHGLFRLDGDVVVPVSEEPLFAVPGPRLLLDGEAGSLLVGTMREGLWTLREGSLEPWPTEADTVLRDGVFNRGVRLADGRLALATFHGGVAVLDREGGFVRHLREETGLPQDGVLHLFADREGGLWCSFQNGVARIDLNGVLSYYDRRNGLPAVTVTEILRHEGTLYLASGDGLFRLRRAEPPAAPQWERIPDVRGEMHDLAAHADGLFAAVQGRVVRIAGDETETVWDGHGLVRVLEPSASDPDRLYVGWRQGLGLVVRQDGRWQSGGAAVDLEAYVQSITEAPDGTVWIGSQRSGVWRLHGVGGAPEAVTSEHFFTAAGLPPNAPLNVFHTGERLEVRSYLGNFAFDPGTGRFTPLPATVTTPALEGWGWDVWTEDRDGRRWGSVYPLEAGNDDFNLYYARQYTAENGEAVWEWIPPGLFEPIGGVLYQYLENGDRPVLWVGGWSGLLRWDLSRAPRGLPALVPAPQLREVRWDGGPPPADRAPAPRELQLAYAGAVMTPGVETLYRTRLQGYEEAWTDWTPDAARSFTNLREGAYRFEVEAKTELARSATAATWSFAIAPPWYRTAWAYAGYLALAAGLVWLLVQWRLRYARRENLRLGSLVEARTAELRESEAGLRAARDEAERANRAKSEFLANMSHELRTPLNGILGYAQILARDSEISGRNRERLSVLESSGQHLLRLINEVLDLSRIEAQRLELKPAVVEPEALVRNLAGMFRPQMEAKGLAFGLTLGPGLPARVQVDDQKVGQVLFNLLGNAVKFTREGRIELEVAAPAPGRLRCEVRDTGPGIPPAEQKRVFEPFRQVESVRAPEPGSGLGLAISRQLVEAMGGHLGLQSTLGEGSCFWFEIPAPTAAAAAEKVPASAPVTGYRGPRREVLVVDDVAVNRGVVRELLEPLGFEVSEAVGGEEALARIAAAPPHLVLLDMRMKPVNGAETIRRLRESEAEGRLPVIAFSASAIDFTRADARALGCDDFVTKPFREEELLERIGGLLGLSWERAVPAGPAPSGTGSGGNGTYRFAAEDLERLRALARRGEPAGLKKLLQEVGAREPEAGAELAPLEQLVARFRLRELSERLEALEAR